MFHPERVDNNEMNNKPIRPIMIKSVVAIACVAVVSGAFVWQYVGESSRQEESGESAASPVAKDFELDKATQQYIWDLEHFTFEIEHHVFPQIIDALQQRNPEQLQENLLEEFTASVSLLEPQVISHGGIVKTNRVAADPPVSAADAAGFSEFLVNSLDEISRIQKVRLRVLQIAAEDRDPKTGHWTLQVLLAASGAAVNGRSISVEQTSTVGCEFLNDEELAVGRIFRSWDVQSETTVSSPTLMEEVTSQVGLDQLKLHDNWNLGAATVRQYTNQIVSGDWNLDGRPDIAIATHTGQSILLMATEDGRFEDVTEDFGVVRSFSIKNRHCCAVSFDFDNDGDEDLLLGPYLYRNQHGKSFRVVNNTGLRLPFNPMGCVVADYDCDGHLDLYVLCQHSPQKTVNEKIGWVGDDQSGAPNQLWRNLGNGRFENVTDKTGVAGGNRHTFAATWLHANDDQYPDLYVANDFAKNSFFINQGDGTFKDIGDPSKTADFATSMGVAAADIDGDGKTEIYVANMYSKMGRRIIGQVSESDYPPGVYQQLRGSCAGNRLYRSSGDGNTYEDISSDLGINSVGWAYAPAFADFDLDGYQDIYATAGFLSFRRDKPDG